MNAGGVRAGNTTTINPLPDGAVYTATAVDNAALTHTCITSGGTCTISVPEVGHKWNVTETTPPAGYYLNPNLDSGTSSSVSSFPYTFQTGTLNGTTTVQVPGAPANGTITSNGQTFSAELATSLNNPAGVAACGLNIALVLDQSGSMAQSGKQAALIAAANDAITDLTGTPSTVAIYTFAATTGPSIAKTSTINASSAAPLHTFINNLPAPSGGTNWDQGLAQVASGFNDVIFLTDGAPTGSRIRPAPGNNFSQSLFTDTEQGIFSANGIKAGGTTRVLGVGIGIGTGTPPSGGTDNLRAVSGPTQNQDYFLGTNNNFGAILKALATGDCNNQLTITKQIQNSSGALISPTPADANGWTFTNTISGDVGDTIVSPVTTAVVNGANGVAAAALTIRPDTNTTLTVTETPQAGYTFVSAQCTVGGSPVTTTVTGTTASFTGAAAQPMGCAFTNRRAGTSTTATSIKNAVGGTTVGGPLPLGSSVFDTSTVTPTPGTITPTGSVAYTFFTNGACTGTGTAAGGGTLASGVPPNSNTQGPLTAGSYSFRAVYSGDANLAGSTSACEPMTINAGTTATATSIKNAVGGTTVGGPLPLGSSVFDTSTVTPTPGTITPTGSVAYTFFTNGACTGTGTAAGGGTLASGVPPNSNTQGPLTAGSYSFRAVYSGDANFAGSTSACEPFSVTAGTSTTDTTVFDAATNAAWTGTETAGAHAFDTASVIPSAGITATGTVTYTFFANAACTGTGTPAGTVTLTATGAVPNSTTQGPLVAGTHSFQAVYSGDTNYAGSTSACEQFRVEPGTSSTATTVFDAATNAAWTGTETAGAHAFDTASVAPSSAGITATGTVTYTFFPNGACTAGTGSPAGTVTLTSTGTVPNSLTQGPLVAGTHSFHAVYSGDANYAGSTSACEPFTVAAGTSTTATTVFDAATNAPWTGNETTGAHAFDTASVDPLLGRHHRHRHGDLHPLPQRLMHGRHGHPSGHGHADGGRGGAQLGHSGAA